MVSYYKTCLGIKRISQEPVSHYLSGIAHEGTAIDLGCGTGEKTDELSHLGFSAIGVDISGAAINIARQRYPNTKFLKIDLETYGPPPLPTKLTIDCYTYNYIQDKEKYLNLIHQNTEYFLIQYFSKHKGRQKLQVAERDIELATSRFRKVDQWINKLSFGVETTTLLLER